MNPQLKQFLCSARQSCITQTQLNYHQKQSIINNLLNQPDSIWLDSNTPSPTQEHIDILCAAPLFSVITRGEQTQVLHNEHSLLNTTTDCPFNLISEYSALAHNQQAPSPFSAGFIGHLSYDLARRLETLPARAQPTSSLPELRVGFYHWSVIIHHARQTITLYYLPINPELTQQNLIKQLTKKNNYQPTPPSRLPYNSLQSNLSKKNYAHAFSIIQQGLTQGNCYQVNLAQKFQLPYTGNAIDLYTYLRPHTQAPFSALINYPQQQILCFSPERFLAVSATGTVETKPIKGTSPRSKDSQVDQANATALLNSTKDKAENLMIVDLLRNDLGKSCIPSSIQVPELFKLESYSVHHLVSKVTGKTNLPPLLLLKSCFPGGSITGAPKLSAMHYIEQLEPHTRDIYCGSIFYLNLAGNLDSNITIRTLLLENNTLHFWAGGGVVADSTLDGEYSESFNKIEFILKALLNPKKKQKN